MGPSFTNPPPGWAVPSLRPRAGGLAVDWCVETVCGALVSVSCARRLTSVSNAVSSLRPQSVPTPSSAHTSQGHVPHPTLCYLGLELDARSAGLHGAFAGRPQRCPTCTSARGGDERRRLRCCAAVAVASSGFFFSRAASAELHKGPRPWVCSDPCSPRI